MTMNGGSLQVGKGGVRSQLPVRVGVARDGGIGGLGPRGALLPLWDSSQPYRSPTSPTWRVMEPGSWPLVVVVCRSEALPPFS